MSRNLHTNVVGIYESRILLKFIFIYCSLRIFILDFASFLARSDLLYEENLKCILERNKRYDIRLSFELNERRGISLKGLFKL